jgi:hypothetical protein
MTAQLLLDDQQPGSDRDVALDDAPGRRQHFWTSRESEETDRPSIDLPPNQTATWKHAWRVGRDVCL